MRALTWHGKHDVRMETVPDPRILNPRDAIIEVTATAICGSDLHLYDGVIAGMRPGDILGALTGDAGIPGDKVGKIAIFDYQAYVPVERSVAREALQRLQSGKIKGRAVKVRML